MTNKLKLFAQAIVNRGNCNTVDAVLDDYNSNKDSSHYYDSEYKLFKEIMKLMEDEK